MQYIDNLYLSRLLEKPGKSQGISCGLESGHPVGHSKNTCNDDDDDDDDDVNWSGCNLQICNLRLQQLCPLHGYFTISKINQSISLFSQLCKRT